MGDNRIREAKKLRRRYYRGKSGIGRHWPHEKQGKTPIVQAKAKQCNLQELRVNHWRRGTNGRGKRELAETRKGERVDAITSGGGEQ